MNEIERILDQLKRAYEGGAWHGPSVREVLEGVTVQAAHARPIANAHSIWEIMHHIAVWEDGVRRRLEGEPLAIETGSPEDWPPPNDTSEPAWEQAKASLEKAHARLIAAVASVPESRLNQPIVEGFSTVYATLHGQIQHELYHAGQIAILKKALS